MMSSHKATSVVIPPVALRKLLVKIENHMRSNPRLKLPYDPRAGGIWKWMVPKYRSNSVYTSSYKGIVQHSTSVSQSVSQLITVS